MTVTSLLSDRKTREVIASVIGYWPKIPLAPVRVPRQTAHPALLGSAFDYLFRFELERRLHPPGAWQSSKWYAINALRAAAHYGHGLDGRLGAATLAEMAEALAEAAHAYAEFQRSGRMTRRTASAALRLGVLEGIARSGLFPHEPIADLVSEEADADELLALLACVPWSDLIAFDDAPVYLNPSLPAQFLVGAADADIVCRAHITELKVATDESDSVRWLHQLVLYYVLVRLGGPNLTVHGRPMSENFELRIYAARHVDLVRIPVASVIDEHGVCHLATWLVKRSGIDSLAVARELRTPLARAVHDRLRRIAS